MTETFDIAIIGAGPAGSNAALMAADNGCRTLLIDEQEAPGGQVWRAKSAAIQSAPETPETRDGHRLRTIISASNVSHYGEARVWQIERDLNEWTLYLSFKGRSEKIVAKALVLATGAYEFVQPTPGWTLPGVIGLAGATALIKQDLLLPGKQIIVSGTGPLVFFVASEIRRLGGEIAAIVTPNSRKDWIRALPSMMSRPDLIGRGLIWMSDLTLAGVPIFWRHGVTQIHGETDVTSVQIDRLDHNWSPSSSSLSSSSSPSSRTIKADSVCLGSGLLPMIEAAQLAGLAIEHRPELGGWVPKVDEDGKTEIDGLFVCGDGAGIRGAAAAEIQGRLAGLTAAEFIGHAVARSKSRLRTRYRRAARFGLAMTALSIPRFGLQNLTTGETIMCRCESLKRSEIEFEINQGATSLNAVKSGLRAGMGPCGGKYCQTSIARLISQIIPQPVSQPVSGPVAEIKDRGQSAITLPAPPTPRPPLRPVPASVLSGDVKYSDLPTPKPAPL